MKQIIQLVVVFNSLFLFFSCSKRDIKQPDNPGPVISNLVYDPKTVTIKQNAVTFIINGVFSFENASGGVTKLRFTNSAGADVTVSVSPNTETSGQLTGTVEFLMPTTPGTYTFEVWIIDGSGKSSNKLSGAIQLIIDDSAIKWSMVYPSWSLHRVIWANNKYIAVGLDGLILNSVNGANWTVQNSGTTNILYGVAWSGSEFIAVGIKRTIITSPDGINWTLRSTDVPDIWLYGIASSGNSMVAVGEDFTNHKTVILHSTDGITWTGNPFSVSGGKLNSVRWTGNQYIAVGSSFGYPVILTSPNGIDWMNRTSSTGVSGELADVVYSGSKYVSVGYGIIAVSGDGINWNSSLTNWGATGITWSGNRFAVSATNSILTSMDGITWTKVADSNYPLRSITWSGLQYVSVGFIYPLIIISP